MSSPNLLSGRCGPSRRCGWANGAGWWTSIAPEALQGIFRGQVGSGDSGCGRQALGLHTAWVATASRTAEELAEHGDLLSSRTRRLACSGPQVPLPTMRRSGRGCFRECSNFFRGPIDGRVTGGLTALGDGREATETSLRKEYARTGRETVGGPWVSIRSTSRPPLHRSVPARADGLAPTLVARSIEASSA